MMKIKFQYLLTILFIQSGWSFAQPKMNLNVGILLPFYSDTSSSVADKEISQATLDFYAGMRIAAEQLNNANISIDFRVWDMKNLDDAELVKLPKSKDFQELDLFFGPITQKAVDLIASNLQKTDFIWVSPLKNLKLPKTVESMNVFAHDSMRIQGLIETLKFKYPRHQVCLIVDPSPNAQVTYYRKYIKNQKINFTEHQYNGGKILPRLPKSDDLLLVNVGTNSFSRIAQFNALNKKGESFIVGTLSWHDDFNPAENVDESKVIYPNINYIDSDNPEVRGFTQQFITAEKAEPSKFAFMGYDQLYTLGSYFASTGKLNISAFPDAAYQGLINTFHFKSTGSKNYENKGIRLIQYEKITLEPIENPEVGK